ncbi:aldose epimerase family protein [Paludicola sp. MB14-C6]|uniref:aldose epimerase family protein n=1 Tax=Paludihabitans sp. MB14-C6 TaxID=3070656 RepID=UPI0027DC03C0|nr:aldose epimerase family protein [Paludicola sp. MB14-C6]WMJ22131.1 aldose epimerase family protein [Paludicola sp. MB14-C6]
MTKIKQQSFSKLSSGEEIQLFCLDNGETQVEIINLGAAIVSITTPDKNGNSDDICLGLSSADAYYNQTAYLGVVAGRYANRIAKGKFSINNNEYQLNCNNGENHLHGGNIGFSKRVWNYKIINDETNPKLRLSLTSPNLEEGFPGTVNAAVEYSLDENNRLTIHYQGTTDQDTVLNLTNHTYFNLAGHNKGTILEHRLFVNGDFFARVNEQAIPTGELVPVKDTPFDFTATEPMHLIGERINADNQDLHNCGGYDHSYALNGKGKQLIQAATLYHEATGRVLNVYTNKPAMQLYTGNALDGTHIGKQGCIYNQNAGVCLETQFMPDSPNQPQFPCCVLKANDVYDYTTVFEFTTKD